MESVIIKLQLDKWQKDFIKTKGDKILCCGRQVGKTEICANDCGEYVQNPENPFPVLMTAPTERQAYNLFDKTLLYLINNYPKSVIMKGVDRPTKSKIELKSGMKIWCLPTGQTGLGIRGITIGRSYEDENSRVADEVESAIAPMLMTTGGARIKLSTPFGARGEFWRTWINKDDAYNSYTRFSINSEEVIRNRPLCDSWTIKQQESGLRNIEQAKARMSNKEFAQEYLGQFIEDLFRFFNDKIIRDSCINKIQAINRAFKYYLGVDIARLGEDSSAFETIQKINNEDFIHVENIITNKTLTTDTHDKIVDLDTKWNFARKGIGIDAGSGSLGVGVMDWLLRDSQVKRKVVAINNRQRVLDHLGNDNTRLLKEDLYQNLLSMMQRGIIKLLDDDDVKSSLQSIQYEYIMKSGQPTKIRIFGNYSHITEGIIRAAYLANQKSLNPSISWM